MFLKQESVLEKLAAEEAFFDNLLSMNVVDMVLQVETACEPTTTVGFPTHEHHVEGFGRERWTMNE
jgi:hypothetical protein